MLLQSYLLPDIEYIDANSWQMYKALLPHCTEAGSSNLVGRSLCIRLTIIDDFFGPRLTGFWPLAHEVDSLCQCIMVGQMWQKHFHIV